MSASMEQRLERVEAELAIRNLAARYAYAVDSRDLDGLTALFVPDVDCGKWGVGRTALADYYKQVLSRFYRSIHLVGSHVVELTGPDTATGKVYCRAEHEVADQWIVELLCYHDSYVKVGDDWLFERRKPWTWLGTDVLERPAGPEFMKWAGHRPAQLPGAFPTWSKYWSEFPMDHIMTITSAPR